MKKKAKSPQFNSHLYVTNKLYARTVDAALQQVAQALNLSYSTLWTALFFTQDTLAAKGLCRIKGPITAAQLKAFKARWWDATQKEKEESK